MEYKTKYSLTDILKDLSEADVIRAVAAHQGPFHVVTKHVGYPDDGSCLLEWEQHGEVRGVTINKAELEKAIFDPVTSVLFVEAAGEQLELYLYKLEPYCGKMPKNRVYYSALDEVDLEGKYVIMRPNRPAPAFQDLRYLVYKAEGGFGCNPHCAGRAVIATCLFDGEEARWDRSDFMRLATEEEVALVQRLKG